MTKLKSVGAVLLVLAFGLLAGAYPASRWLAKQASLSVIDAMRGAGRGIFPVQSIDYEDIEIQGVIPREVLLRNFKVDVGAGVSIVAESLSLSYSVSDNMFNIALPGGSVQIFGLPQDAEDESGAVECKTSASYSAVFEDSLLMHVLRKLVLGNAAKKNEVVKFTYSDEGGVACFDAASGGYVSVYDRAHLSVEDDELASKGGEQEFAVTLNSEVVRNEGADGSGGLFLQAKGLSLSQSRGSAEAERALYADIQHIELRSDGFSLLVHGNTSLSESCMLISPARCKSDLHFELRGFAEFSKFVADIVQQTRLGKEHEAISEVVSEVNYMALFEVIIDAIKSASIVAKDDADTITFTIKSNGNKLTIGTMSFLEFSELVMNKVREAKIPGL
ncbi:hypothetical protein AOV_02305 [Anaplasma ovis str. Haibei]|uniref:Uncharacterized protein n=2 Tax=cellular organisms TaxID=131567 RepID=A0A6A6K073_HEVBR|nr:hypothetical protein [Anaplasma ovis]ASI47689.1 hypothetical protein AOV_02305 [Anaplasma ovis str. Haibei]KAF2281884.1 hypothetical protein GH714_042708 [Hevea brasiliensis]